MTEMRKKVFNFTKHAFIADKKTFVFYDGWVGGSKCEIYYNASETLTEDSILFFNVIKDFPVLYHDNFWLKDDFYFYDSMKQVEAHDAGLVKFIANDFYEQHCDITAYSVA